MGKLPYYLSQDTSLGSPRPGRSTMLTSRGESYVRASTSSGHDKAILLTYDWGGGELSKDHACKKIKLRQQTLQCICHIPELVR